MWHGPCSQSPGRGRSDRGRGVRTGAGLAPQEAGRRLRRRVGRRAAYLASERPAACDSAGWRGESWPGLSHLPPCSSSRLWRHASAVPQRGPLCGLRSSVRAVRCYGLLIGWACWLRPTLNRRSAWGKMSAVRAAALRVAGRRRLCSRRSRQVACSPPCDVHHSGAWDDYWKNQLKFGAMEQSLADDMASDATLPGLLSQRGARTILCAGNGLSSEPVALALYGFDVTALDSSAVPAEAFGRTFRNPEHPVVGFPDSSCAMTIDALRPSRSHRPCVVPAHAPECGSSACRRRLSVVHHRRPHESGCLPGPFDVVIERRTLQLFPEVERIAALDRLVARLADRGVFVSHQHARGWRPGEARTHHAAAWLESRGFALRSGTAPGESDSAARLAYLMFSSG